MNIKKIIIYCGTISVCASCLIASTGGIALAPMVAVGVCALSVARARDVSAINGPTNHPCYKIGHLGQSFYIKCNSSAYIDAEYKNILHFLESESSIKTSRFCDHWNDLGANGELILDQLLGFKEEHGNRCNLIHLFNKHFINNAENVSKNLINDMIAVWRIIPGKFNHMARLAGTYPVKLIKNLFDASIDNFDEINYKDQEHKLSMYCNGKAHVDQKFKNIINAFKLGSENKVKRLCDNWGSLGINGKGELDYFLGFKNWHSIDLNPIYRFSRLLDDYAKKADQADLDAQISDMLAICQMIPKKFARIAQLAGTSSKEFIKKLHKTLNSVLTTTVINHTTPTEYQDSTISNQYNSTTAVTTATTKNSISYISSSRQQFTSATESSITTAKSNDRDFLDSLFDLVGVHDHSTKRIIIAAVPVALIVTIAGLISTCCFLKCKNKRQAPRDNRISYQRIDKRIDNIDCNHNSYKTGYHPMLTTDPHNLSIESTGQCDTRSQPQYLSTFAPKLAADFSDSFSSSSTDNQRLYANINSKALPTLPIVHSLDQYGLQPLPQSYKLLPMHPVPSNLDSDFLGQGQTQSLLSQQNQYQCQSAANYVSTAYNQDTPGGLLCATTAQASTNVVYSTVKK